MTRSLSFSVQTALLLIAGTPFAIAAAAQTNSVTVPASPSVLATVMSANGHLRLLVLWRGTANWWSRPSGHVSNSCSEGANGFGCTLEYGGTALTFLFDSYSHTFQLRGKPIKLSDAANVVLVDNVDSQAGPRLVHALSVEPGDANIDPRAGGLGSLYLRSEELVMFLRCDTGQMTKMIDLLGCAEIAKK